jgi:hypothetical protein
MASAKPFDFPLDLPTLEASAGIEDAVVGGGEVGVAAGVRLNRVSWPCRFQAQLAVTDFIGHSILSNSRNTNSAG